jgi:SUKH superfamily protein
MASGGPGRTAPPDVDLEYDPKSLAGPLDPKEVEQAERFVGMRFDPDWVAHLAQFNGGKPGKREFELGKNVKVVTRFLPIVPGFATDHQGHGAMDVRAVRIRIEDRLHDRLVPFVALYPGDYLCFEYAGPGRPRVVFWDHERSRPGKPYTEPVAESFADFLPRLHRGENA